MTGVETPVVDRPVVRVDVIHREPRSGWSVWAPIPLRLVLGIGFLYHGVPLVLSAGAHARFVAMLQGLGVPAPGVSAWVVGLVEFLGAIGFLAGAFVTVFAVLNIVVMLVAMVTVHLDNGFSFIHIVATTPAGPVFGMPGYEPNLLYLAALTALWIGGPGAASVDRLWRRSSPTLRA